MNINPGFTVGIMNISPDGENSTMFTECCETAICNDQRKCPACDCEVIGHDAETDHERGQVRWRDATGLWNR